MQISTGLRSYKSYQTQLLSSQNRPSEEVPGEAAQWFVEHYPELTQLSEEFIDSLRRHLCLWQGQGGLLATVYDSRNHTFKTLSGSQIRNGLNPHEPPHILQARLASSPCVQWDLVLRDNTLYVWPRLRAAAWQDFIPTDGTINKPSAAFSGANTLTQAMGVLYKEGFTTSETARVCIQYQEQKQTFVTELQATDSNNIKEYLNKNGEILAVSLYDRSGNTKAGIEFRHPQDKSQTTFHADFSEDRAHIDVRVGNGTKIPQAEKKVNFQEFGGKNLNSKEFSQFVKSGGRYPDGPGGGGSGSKGSRGGSDGNSGSGGEGSGGNNSKPGGSGGKPGAGGGSTAGFQDKLNQSNLTKSYNGAHPDHPMQETAHQQDIGGVAVGNPNGILLNLNSSLYDLTADGYWITFPFLTDKTDKAPFSNQWLQQIIRELAQNVYIHNTFPFYSLHFTKEGTLYSVIHPAYQNTLVGKVIGMIDYFMKGYLNGGYFNEADLIRFAGDKSSWINNVDQLKPSIQSMDALYQETFKDDSEYTPLIQLLQKYHIKQYGWKIDDTTLDKIQQRFQISFRIIAKQEQIEKHDSTLLFHGGMDVLFTIECHRGALGQVEQYEASDEYQKLQLFCKTVANDIKTRLAQLPPCQDYFKMLDVICALSYYFSSLKRQGMVPKLLPVIADAQQTCLGLFPPYPKTQLEPKFNVVTLWDVIQDLDKDGESATLFEEFLRQESQDIAPQLQTALANVIQKLLPKESLKATAEDLNFLVLLLTKQMLNEVSKLKKKLFSTEVEQQQQEALRQAKENLEELEAERLSLREQLEPIINQQRQKIEQVSIPNGYARIFQGVRYTSESRLKDAMRRSFNIQLEAAYQKDVKSLDEDIAKAGSRLEEVKAALAKINTMRRSIHTNPSHQAIAEAIPLAMLSFMKKPPTFVSTADEAPVVRIHGGTGFKLEDKAILLNTALVSSLNQQLDEYSASMSEKDPGEVWKAVTINHQSYQAFYLEHASLLDNSALEQSLIKPNMASTAMEKQWIHLAAQAPSEAQLDAATEFIANNKLTLNLNLNITDAYGNTALHLAAMNNNLELAKLLLKHGVKINGLNQFGNSPLHVASMYGHDEIISAIHQANENSIHQLTMNDESALCLAVLHHNLETVKLLVSYGSNVNEIGINGIPLIYTALYHHSFEISDYLLSDPRINVHFQLENGNTLLHLAVLVNAQEMIQPLLSKQVDLSVQNRDGKTPLHIAVALGYLNIVKQLLDKEDRGRLDSVRRLLDQDNRGYLDSVRQLLDQHTPLERADSAGNTPLHLAIKHHQNAVTDYLLEKGAKTSQRIEEGNALTHALKTGQISVAKAILKAKKFKLNIYDQIDQDSFLWMCKLGLWRLCEHVIVSNPKWITQALAPDHAELNCYIDYLCKHDRVTQVNHLLGNFKARTSAYLKAHAAKLYELAIKHRSHAMLDRLQPMLQGVNPYPLYSKLFKKDQLASYSNYNLIQFAVRYGLPQFYEPYLARVRDRATLEYPTIDGKSLLYLAAESGNRQLIETLLDKQARPIAPNGRHIFYALIEHDHPDIIRSLLLDERYRSSLNINGLVSEKEKIRAIDLACKRGDLKMATSLIQWGAKIDEPNQLQQLPIYYAIENNAPHLIRLIFKYEIGDLEKILNHAIGLHKNEIFQQLLGNRSAFKKEILHCANSLLATAIEHHNVDAYKRLIGLGAKVDNALLHLAIISNAHEIVPLLIAAGCDRHAEVNELTPLELACELDHDLCVHALLQGGGPLSLGHGVKPSKWTGLILKGEMVAVNQKFIDAIKRDDLGKVQELTKRYAPINLQYLYNGKEINVSLLDIAILENKPKIIQYLFNDRCCDPYTPSSLGSSAVHELMKLSDAQFVVELIKKFKLDINRVNPRSGITPLHVAQANLNQALVGYLMANGADMYAEMADGKNVFQIAIEQKDLDFIKCAIKEHAYDLHHKNSLQECALAMALKAGNLEIAQYLIEAGADINSIDGFTQRTMLHYAVLSRDAKAVFYVLSCGVQTSIPDNKGMLPVHLAAKQGDLEIVDLLDDIEEREGREGTVVALTDLRDRDVRDFALIHRHTELSAHLTQKHELPLHNKATSNQPIGFKTYRQGDKTPLELAILADDQATVVDLIDQVVDQVDADDTFHIKRALTAASTSQNSALFDYVISTLWDGKNQQILQACLASAIANNRTENVKKLLSMMEGNRNNLILNDGSTPIVLACAAEAHDVLKELLAHIQPTHQEIYAAFQQLIQHDQLVMAKLLYACDKAAIHTTDTNGETLLHHAVKHNRPNMVAFFILCGCVDKENYGGQTALSKALLAHQTECIKYLTTAYPPGVKAGQSLLQYIVKRQRLDYATLNWLCRFQDMNAQDETGQTALHYVIQRQDFRAVEILLTHQADITLTNQHNQDALQLASADPSMFEKIAKSIHLPHVIWSVGNSHRDDRISVIKELLASANKDQRYLYELLTRVVNSGSEANAKYCAELYQQLYPNAPALLESAYQAYRQSEDSKQATHARVLSWLLENHHNPYTAFGSKLAEIKSKPKLGRIYQAWYNKQWKTLSERLNHNLQFKSIDGVLEMLKSLMPQIEEGCARANTYDDASWAQLFLFFDAAIIQVSDVAPEALITAMQSAATPTGQDIIRKAVAQPYLRDLIASVRRGSDTCVIL